MKQTVKRLFICLLALALILSAAACKLTDEDTANVPDAGAVSAQGGADSDAVAVSIGDKYFVTRGEVADMYDNMVAQYSYFGMEAPTADADIESLQDTVVEMLAEQKLQQYQAEQMGVELDSDALDGIEADTEDEMAQVTSQFRAQAEAEGAEDVDARTVEIFNEQLLAAGLDMDMEGYRAYVKEQLTKEAEIAALEEKVKSGAVVADGDAQAYYDELLSSQKETYAEHPGDYLADEESYEKFGGDPILVTPEGYLRVHAITIVPAGERTEEASTLSADMEKLEAEYGKLMLADAGKDAARIAEIKTEYAEKSTRAAELEEAYMADAQKKADEAYAALQGGMTFVDAIQQFGEDEVYTTYPSFINTGLLMQKGVASSTWPQALVDAVDKLKAGEYSAVIPEGDSFYIVSLVGDEPTGELPFSDVEEEITRRATDRAGETLWTETQDEWINDPSLVVYHEDVYRDVGKAQG